MSIGIEYFNFLVEENREKGICRCKREMFSNRQDPTQECFDQIGRYGQRPAHIHYFLIA